MLRWIEVQPDGFADGATLRGLESQGIDYVARIRNNAVLDRMACPYLRRPPGRPPREGQTCEPTATAARGCWGCTACEARPKGIWES